MEPQAKLSRRLRLPPDTRKLTCFIRSLDLLRGIDEFAHAGAALAEARLMISPQATNHGLAFALVIPSDNSCKLFVQHQQLSAARSPGLRWSPRLLFVLPSAKVGLIDASCSPLLSVIQGRRPRQVILCINSCVIVIQSEM